MTNTTDQPLPLPGERLEFSKMPGHWLLARLGKRVLRPGGLELTRAMLHALDIRPADSVVEFAPGLGVTAQMTLQNNPASYTAVEQDENAARLVRRYLHGPDQTCVVGEAADTGLPAGSASAVYGEAMLTMASASQKAGILREAHRLLRDGGRYGIHEMCLVPDDLDEATKRQIQKELARSIRVNARPLTVPEWSALMASAGFQVRLAGKAPMHLLVPRRFVQDEGLAGTLRFIGNLLRHPEARRRVWQMRSVFHKYRHHLAAVTLIGRKAG